MKRTFLSVLVAAAMGLAALGFAACSEEDISVGNGTDSGQQKGMVLRATVEQPAASRATISDAWLFDFVTGDEVSVTNTAIEDTYYTFTNGGKDFTSADAAPTASAATWYAYFPSNTVDLTGQSGTRAGVAGKYALAGKTESATAGDDGLSITLSPKVAILVIKNYKGEININVKSGEYLWVTGLAAKEDGFNVTTSNDKQDLLSVTEAGTYYVAVPAGRRLAVKDGDKVIRSTGQFGLTAGRYYELDVEAAPGQGKAKATINGSQVDVNWVQLWAGGPKFAECNVGVADGNAASCGGYYEWADDIASTQWGSNWRMPTQAEYEALLENCDVESVKGPVDEEGAETFLGIRFTGRTETAYAGNSVFFPAAGQCINGMSVNEGYTGFYWSSTADGDEKPFMMCFDPEPVGPVGEGRTNPGMMSDGGRDGCFSVRAVLAE